MFERLSFDRGVHLRGTPLWFDATRRRELCILTSLGHRLPPAHRRLVASPPICEALQRAGGAGVLPAPWERWIGLGGQQVQLLSAGESGEAFALVASGRERILVAGLLRHTAIDWPQVDTLVAVAPALAHRGGELPQVLQGLALFIEEAARAKSNATVLVDTLGLGLQLFAALAAIGHRPRPLGPLAKLIGPVDAGQPALKLMVGGGAAAKGRVAWIDSGVSDWLGNRPAQELVAATFRWRAHADAAVLRQMVSATRARHAVLVGVRDVAAVSALLPGVHVRCLASPEQLTMG